MFHFSKKVNPRNGGTDDVVNFTISNNTITFNGEATSSVVTKEKWGLKTNRFFKVKQMFLSPNFWQGEIGNKHFIFSLEGCVNDEKTRPFFNEFIHDKYLVNKRVFEVLGGKLEISYTKEQVSGLGFSETQSNNLIVKVKGQFERIIKITI